MSKHKPAIEITIKSICRKTFSRIFVRNELSYESGILYVDRHTEIHLYDSVCLYDRAQAHLGMPKVISNIKGAPSGLKQFLATERHLKIFNFKNLKIFNF